VKSQSFKVNRNHPSSEDRWQQIRSSRIQTSKDLQGAEVNTRGAGSHNNPSPSIEKGHVARDQHFADSQLGKSEIGVVRTREVRVRDLIATVDQREGVDR
jgi:hypothetical protein